MRYVIGIFLLGGVYFAFPAKAQTGGGYDLSHNVIAGGGGSNSTGGGFTLSATSGQSLAGGSSTGAGFSLRGGFWALDVPVVTAAEVNVSGRVVTSDGRGIVKVRVSMTDMGGAVRTALTGPFGYYRFENVLTGRTYIITVSSKRFTFSAPTRIMTISDELTDVDFIAEPLK